ncbi:MAG: hypothetical protein IPJ07_08975 [Acidobacteria bacterium]|nr:hypothetical protein [Acidobacteriota bacterium]
MRSDVHSATGFANRPMRERRGLIWDLKTRGRLAGSSSIRAIQPGAGRGAFGHGFGPNPERGVIAHPMEDRLGRRFSTKDENTGAIDLAFDPDDSQTVCATLNTRRVAWSRGAPN